MSEEQASYGEILLHETVLGIDPGPQFKGSGFSLIKGRESVIAHGMAATHELDRFISLADVVCIEMVSNYGMAVGADVFNTVVELGRIIEMCVNAEKKVYLPLRREIKLVVCGTSQAKDSNVRAAILAMYPQTGGGSTPAIGVQKQKGPLFGMKSHAVPALAAALWYYMAESERGMCVGLSKYEWNNCVRFFD